MSLLPEVVLRAVLAKGIYLLRDNLDLCKTLFLVEEELIPDLGEKFNEYLKDHRKIPVVINFPPSDLDIPNVAVVSPDSAEELAYLGDYLGVSKVIGSEGGRLESDGTRTIATADSIGNTDRANFRCVVTTKDELVTAMLTSALRFLLFHAKFRLGEYGIFNLELGESDFMFPQEYWPTLTWSKSIKISAYVNKIISTESLRNTEDEELWNSVQPVLNSFIASGLTVEIDGELTTVME